MPLKKPVYRNNLAIWYVLLLAAASLSWMVWYTPDVPRSIPAYFSCGLGIACLFSVYLLLDSRLVNGWARFLLAGFAALFATYVLVDAALLHVTSIRLHHAFSILNTGGNLLVSLGQAGFRPMRLLGLIGVLCFGFVAGGLMHRYLPRRPEPGRNRFRIAGLMCVLLTGFYFGEQAWSASTPIYHTRDMVYPGCWQVFSGGPNGFTELIAPPLSVEARRERLHRIEPLTNPPNVIFVVLESVRADMLGSDTMPNLDALAVESLDFKNAYAAAGFTHLSWNTILLDRPAFTFWFDHERPVDGMAALPLEVANRAGYDVQLSISTVLDYKGFGDRVRGNDGIINRYFQGNHFAPGADPLVVPLWDSVKADREAADHAADWIAHQPEHRPFYLLINFNATHWPYQFDESIAIDRPYLPDGEHLEYRGEKQQRLSFARYRNAANQVDRNLGRVIAALKARGLYDSTAIVVTSDHGEAFLPGFVGHSSLKDCVRRVPLVMKLPGVAPRRVEQFISHQDIYPTLFEYLGVKGIEPRTFMGHSVLAAGAGEDGVLTVSGTVRTADLTTDQYVIQFNIKSNLEQITFMPTMITDREGNPLGESVEQFRRIVESARPALKRFVSSRTEHTGAAQVPILAAHQAPSSAAISQAIARSDQ